VALRFLRLVTLRQVMTVNRFEKQIP